ncbi:hypothetical protein CWE12_11005 [Aliidiomarina sedimenti]|uniref:Uncharacterized protein n=1 Tax=Aliidiomarina sedimenti TaxID=1933879 RepID=A0ABY0BWQ6_9GAMM|nr:hypothetical protein [Aliidiomarina sedimenti]RUO28830.1 hypothetical protein CWE12_11005 [Aliidiomarina sedimenti]
MKRLLLIGLCLICWALATSVKADTNDEDSRGFSYRIEGQAVLADGEEIEVDMLLGFQRSQTRGWYFRAGPDYIFRDTPPQAYYLNLILDGEGHAYILEFSDQPIKTFLVTVDDYELELMPTENPEINFGVRLRMNERQYLFDSSHPRLRFELTEDGLSTIVAERTMRDLSIRRAE